MSDVEDEGSSIRDAMQRYFSASSPSKSPAKKSNGVPEGNKDAIKEEEEKDEVFTQGNDS